MSSSISGNAGQPGAKVWWATDNPSFTPNGSVTADGAGNYTISGLADAQYIVNPSLVGFTFSVAQTPTISGSNVTGINFTSTAIPAITLTQLVAESFTEANANPLNPARWTVLTGFTALQVLSNVCQGTGTPGSDESGERYTGTAFLANQYAEVKVSALTGDSLSELLLQVLTNADDTALEGMSLSNNGDGTATFAIYNASNNHLFLAIAPFAVGDVWRIEVLGHQIIVYQNGTQVAGTEDASSPASGSPSILMFPETSLTDVTVTNFAAGSVHATPAPPFLKGYGMQLPILLQPGQNGYFYGTYNANKPNPHFQVTATAGDGATATINVKQQEGFTPLVGDLITVTGTTRASGAFNTSNVALIAVSLNPVTGVGTLQYASTGNAVSAADFGEAEVLNDEIPEVLANGASVAVAIQTAAGQNDNGKNIAWASSFPTAPIAVTLSLQGALFDKDSDYQTIASTTSITGDNIVISNVTQRFYRVLASGVSGAATVISKITI